ncbi:MAG TPA: helix-turn-helix domain-containing protein [Patescibacteria group bacterium]|nr:helix-turn-helix domain-containing protein [Patescibacteria group bacterium]
MIRNFTDYSLLGLDSRDMRVYETLYGLDKGSLRTIASATGLNRGTVYEVVKKLSGIGLVSFTQNGERRHYRAAEPEVFLALIRDQRDRLQQLEVPAAQYAADLQAQKHPARDGYSAQFYEDNEGIASILRDLLQTVTSLPKREYCVISSQRASNFIYANFKSFTRQRHKLGVNVRVLADTPSTEKLILAERKLLPAGSAPLNGYQLVYGDKTALISIDEANRLFGIVITDAGTANMQRLIFNQLWHQS